MKTPWNHYDFSVDMLHLAPVDKLSEIEIQKIMAISQWSSIAHLLGRPTQQIVGPNGERLYSALVDAEIDFAGLSPERFREGTRAHLKNRINLYAKRFVEGLFVFDVEPVPEEKLEKISCKADLKALGLPWAYMTTAFISPFGSNAGLKIFQPAGLDALPYTELREPPVGIGEQRAVQATGEIADFGDGLGIPLAARDSGPIEYEILPESDLNGAGLVLFARYVSMADYAVRRFLSERIDPPLSAPLIQALSTERRHTFYFGNAPPSDRIEMTISAELLPVEATRTASGHRRLCRFLFRIDLYRSSDKVLIASTLVRKALNAPGDAKAVHLEAQRLLNRLT